MNQWLMDHLVCPKDHGTLQRSGQELECRASQLLRRSSEHVKPLRKLADSVYLESVKRAPEDPQ